MEKKGLIGIVVVCHNKNLAQEIINFSEILKVGNFNIENGGGTSMGMYGTSKNIVKNAVRKADKGAGVMIFVDLGSAIMSAEEAVNELKDEIDVRIINAPLFEGVISAVAANCDDMSMDEIEEIAVDSKNYDKVKSKN